MFKRRVPLSRLGTVGPLPTADRHEPRTTSDTNDDAAEPPIAASHDDGDDYDDDEPPTTAAAAMRTPPSGAGAATALLIAAAASSSSYVPASNAYTARCAASVAIRARPRWTTAATAGRGGAPLGRTSLPAAPRPTATATELRMSAAGEAAASAPDEGAGKGDDSASSSAAPSSEGPSLSVLAVLVSAFLNLLGFTMAGPINPALGRHFGLDVGASFGSLTSAYPLGMLFGLFLWPSLSDRIGRKPVMAASLLGSGLGLAAQANAIRSGWSLRNFLLIRTLTGSFAGSSPVSKAYLADLGMAAGSLPRYLAWRDAASTLSFIAGPALGGLFFEARRAALSGASAGADAAASLAYVIGISSAASLAAAAMIALFVREIPKRKKPKNKDTSAQDDDFQTYEDDKLVLVSCPLGRRLWTGVATVCVVSFLFNIGDSTFHAFFPALLRYRLGLDARAIGLAFASFACVSFCASAGVAGRMIRELGPVPTCAAGLGCVGAGLLGLAAGAAGGGGGATAAAAVTMAPFLAFAAAALYYCGVPLYGPTVPTMLLRCVPPNKRGAVMGLDGAINTVARVLSPLAVGELYRRRGPTAAFGFAGTAVLGAAALAVTRRLVVMKKQGMSIKKRGGMDSLIHEEKRSK